MCHNIIGPQNNKKHLGQHEGRFTFNVANNTFEIKKMFITFYSPLYVCISVCYNAANAFVYHLVWALHVWQGEDVHLSGWSVHEPCGRIMAIIGNLQFIVGLDPWHSLIF